MALLVINFGSSNVKFSLFDKKKRILDLAAPHNHFHTLLKKLMKECDVETVAHRFVHGGLYTEPFLVKGQSDLAKLKKMIPLDPLHNPLCFHGVETALEMCALPQVVVFDTAFFHDLPDVAREYALPRALVKKYGIRRYGFHGSAHEALALATKHTKVITAHLGSGCSMAAIKSGMPMDTSMGFTPLEGLIMSTRPGDLDPGLVAFLSEKKEDLTDLLNHKSGLLGLAGTTDMREILKKHPKAVDLFCYRAEKYIGAYTAALKGLDALIFSGGIGENCPQIRRKLVPHWLGAELDAKANLKAIEPAPGEKIKISSKKSAVHIYVVGADENRIIAEKAHGKIN